MFQYSYLCGANVSIFVDSVNLRNVKIKNHILDKIRQKIEPLDSAAVHYTLNSSVQPIYSHHAHKFDAIVLGREIVQGSIILNYKDFTYFYKQINPEMYVNHLLSNKTFGDSNSFSNYVDYNYLPPFNIYIVENGNIERQHVRVHLLNNCYIGSRGQSIYSDDQNVIEEYSFIAQSYTFANYVTFFVNTEMETLNNDSLLPAPYTETPPKPKKESVDEKPAAPKSQVNQNTQSEGPVNTNDTDAEVEAFLKGSDKALDELGKVANALEGKKVDSNANTATTPLPPDTKKEQPPEKKKSSDKIIQDPTMQNDIRNFDKVLGANPEATYVLMNNLILPKYGLKDNSLLMKSLEEQIGDKTPEDYKQYTQEHFNKILEFANNKNKNDQSINDLINQTEFQIPLRYATGGAINVELGGNIPSFAIPPILNPQKSYLQMVLDDYQVDTSAWNINDYIDNKVKDNRLFKKSMEHSQALTNIYRTESNGFFPRGTLFDMPLGLANTPEEQATLNQQKMDYANRYKELSKRWSDSSNAYTYHNDWWLNETLMPNTPLREPSDWYINDRGKITWPNYVLADGNYNYDSYGKMLWDLKGYYPDAANYNPNFFEADSTLKFLNTFYNAETEIDPIYAMYGIMSDFSDATQSERQSNLEEVSNLINHINDNYVKNKTDQDTLKSLLELSKRIYYYGPNGQTTTLYDSWINSTGTRSSRWSVR